jgi:hypothetical protein
MKFAVVYSYRKLPGSAVVRWVQGTDFSHVSILVTSEDGQFIYESVWPKSRKIEFKEWAKHYIITKIVTLPTPPHPPYAEYKLNELLWKPYSIAQLVAIFFTNAFKLFYKPDINGSMKLVCSEYVARFLETVYSVEIPDDDYVDLIKIDEIVTELSKRSGL